MLSETLNDPHLTKASQSIANVVEQSECDTVAA